MRVLPDSDPDNPMRKIFFENTGYPSTKWHHYFDVYHNHFQRFIGKSVRILEIGVANGGSLQLWKKYFGSQAIIYGLDVDPNSKRFEDQENGIHIFIGDQGDRRFLKQLRQQTGVVDIIIDDGGHTMDQQITSFEHLYHYVDENGIYLVEDLHTSYWREYGGGYRRSGSFIEKAKGFIDCLNAWHSRSPELSPSMLTKSCTGIHFYDSILVLEKCPNNTRPTVSTRGSL